VKFVQSIFLGWPQITLVHFCKPNGAIKFILVLLLVHVCSGALRDIIKQIDLSLQKQHIACCIIVAEVVFRRLLGISAAFL
jgi:hypothetical protein